MISYHEPMKGLRHPMAQQHLLARLHEAFKSGVTEPDELIEMAMQLPKEALRPAVSSYTLTFISTRTRQAQHRMLRTSRKAREMQARRLAGERDINMDVFREAVVDSYEALLLRTFHVPSINGTRTWRDATIDEHEEHIAYRRKVISEYDRTILMHVKAVDFLRKYKLRNIASITDAKMSLNMAMALAAV